MIRAAASLVLFSVSLGACAAPRHADAPPGGPPAPAATTLVPGALRPPAVIIAELPDRVPRSRALFAEAARVLQHPRCLGCHPDGDSPLQDDASRLHDPPVVRGPKDEGVVGVQCGSCHQDRNLELARVPGAPKWHLAPRTMAWAGKTPGQICAQLKDPARNGGRTLAQIVEHSGHDALVGWGWAPGADREPAPGSQALFGNLVAAWVDSGAECPAEEVSR